MTLACPCSVRPRDNMSIFLSSFAIFHRSFVPRTQNFLTRTWPAYFDRWIAIGKSIDSGSCRRRLVYAMLFGLLERSHCRSYDGTLFPKGNQARKPHDGPNGEQGQFQSILVLDGDSTDVWLTQMTCEVPSYTRDAKKDNGT